MGMSITRHLTCCLSPENLLVVDSARPAACLQLHKEPYTSWNQLTPSAHPSHVSYTIAQSQCAACSLDLLSAGVIDRRIFACIDRQQPQDAPACFLEVLFAGSRARSAAGLLHRSNAVCSSYTEEHICEAFSQQPCTSCTSWSCRPVECLSTCVCTGPYEVCAPSDEPKQCNSLACWAA